MDLSQDVPQPDVVSVCMWNVKQMRASYGLLQTNESIMWLVILNPLSWWYPERSMMVLVVKEPNII